jgi:hypothetical protein
VLKVTAINYFRMNDRNASGYGSYGSIQELRRFIGKLKPFTLYAFYVEAVTLNKKGARSSLEFLETREMGKIANVLLELLP